MIEFEKTLVRRESLPLFLKRILFTTPRNYAAKLSRLLVLRGALPVWMPTIVIESMPDYHEFDQVIKNLSDYSWIAFTSRNGIEAFFDFSHFFFAIISQNLRLLIVETIQKRSR